MPKTIFRSFLKDGRKSSRLRAMWIVDVSYYRQYEVCQYNEAIIKKNLKSPLLVPGGWYLHQIKSEG